MRAAMKPTTLAARAAATLLAVCTLSAAAQTKVDEPWVRATVAQQKATGFFARVTSPAGGRLVSAASPVAGVVEIHEMAMEGDVMRMRALTKGLELPPGRTVELKPGGYHIMLMDLKKALAAGETVPLTLIVEGAGGQRETLQLQAPVKPLASR
jgi:periplasmic copper chaperone A